MGGGQVHLKYNSSPRNTFTDEIYLIMTTILFPEIYLMMTTMSLPRKGLAGPDSPDNEDSYPIGDSPRYRTWNQMFP